MIAWLRRSLPSRLALAALMSAALAAALWRLPELSVELGPHTIELIRPEALRLLALLPLLVAGMWRSLADLPLIQRWLGLFARALAMSLLALALARPARTLDATRVATVFLVDVSESVSDRDLARADERIARAWQARGENVLRLVTFAREARAVEADEEAGPPRIARHEGEGSGAESDLAAALQLAYGLYPPGHLRRAVVLSDGAETRGHALTEAQRAAALGIRIHHAPYADGPPPEVAVIGIDIPEGVRVGQPFTARARVFSSAASSARLRFYQGETLNGLDAIREVELAEGTTEVSFRSVVHVPGPVTYRLDVEPAEGSDRFGANNRFATALVVPGRPAVLLVDGSAGSATYLARALVSAELDVDVRTPRAIPTTTAELERFDFFILSDVPAEDVSPAQEEAIERWIRAGGGFLMAGGDHGFGIGGWRGRRLERVLPVRMEGERRRDQPSVAIALVIDRSGSMQGEKIEMARNAASATAELLSAEDYLEVVGFDAQPQRVVRMQSAGNRMQIIRDISRLVAGGGTAIFPALDLAFQDLSVTRARLKHVILLTDGQTQETGLSELAAVMHAEGITISSVGIGADVNRTLLREIADVGGGRAYFTASANNLPRIFVQETTTVARNDVVEELIQVRVRAPADFLRGLEIGSAPYLHGYVATTARPAPAQVILDSDLSEPILARWRVGLGWSLAWTSDVKNRWSVEWLRWAGFSRFWAQLVREHLRQDRETDLPMHAETAGDLAHVAVDAIDDDDEFINGLTSTVTIEGPMGAPRREQIRQSHPMRQTAPGRYEADIPLDRYGSFVISAEHRVNGRLVAESRTQLARPYPRE